MPEHGEIMEFINLESRYIPISLCGADISDYSIIVHSESPIYKHAAPNVLKAATELRKYIAQITGITIPVISDYSPLIKNCEIIIGLSNRKESNLNNSAYENDEYLIKTIGSKLIINGGQRGVIYGAYSFLEKYCGVRFFTDCTEKIINTTKITIDSADEQYAPVIEYREMSFWNAWDTNFSVKSKLNGLMIRELNKEWGGGIGYAGGPKGLVHTFSHLLPAEYFATHPEYFALNEQGKRDPSGICFSNKEAYKIIVKNAFKWLEDMPEGNLSISINDGNVAYCMCKDCAKVTAEEESITGGLLRFVNKVAGKVAKVYPKAKVDTLIYGKIEHLPKLTRPAKNVVIRVTGCFVRSHSLLDYSNYTESKNNEELVAVDEKIKAWSSICSKIYVWDYPAHYVSVNTVFPHFITMFKNIKYYLNHKAKGFYINGNGGASCQFSEMTVYLLAKLMWNPNMSEQQYNDHIDEFLCGYYGAGWKYIREFIDYTQELVKGRVFSAVSSPEQILPYNKKAFTKMKLMFEKAKSAAIYDCEKHRIQRLEIQINYHEIYLIMDKDYPNANETQRAEFVIRNKKLYDDIKKHGILRIRERAFLPVVKDFRQSPVLWEFWDHESRCADRNNNNFDRDIYGIIESDLPKGTKVDADFLFYTNNINTASYGSALSSDGAFSFFSTADENKIPLQWDNFKKYCKVHLKNVVITDLQEFATAFDMPVTDNAFSFIPWYKQGIIIKINDIDAGAFYMIKEVNLTII